MHDKSGDMHRSHWRFFTDAVMGGISTGQVAFGQDRSHGYARLTGHVSTANSGGFIQIQRRLDAPLPAGVSNFRLTARGNGERYFVHLRSIDAAMPTAFWRAAFETHHNWQDIILLFSDFTPSQHGLPMLINPTRVSTVAVVAYGRDHVVDVSIADTGFR